MRYLKRIYDFAKEYKQFVILIAWVMFSVFMTNKKKPQVHIHNNYYTCDSVMMANLTKLIND